MTHNITNENVGYSLMAVTIYALWYIFTLTQKKNRTVVRSLILAFFSLVVTIVIRITLANTTFSEDLTFSSETYTLIVNGVSLITTGFALYVAFTVVFLGAEDDEDIDDEPTPTFVLCENCETIYDAKCRISKKFENGTIYQVVKFDKCPQCGKGDIIATQEAYAQALLNMQEKNAETGD